MKKHRIEYGDDSANIIGPDNKVIKSYTEKDDGRTYKEIALTHFHSLNEEVPANNISSGAIVDPQNRRLGIQGRVYSPKQYKKGNATSSLFKRWRERIDII